MMLQASLGMPCDRLVSIIREICEAYDKKQMIESLENPVPLSETPFLKTASPKKTSTYNSSSSGTATHTNQEVEYTCAITSSRLSRLGTELRVVCEESRVRFIPNGLMLSLMPALDACVTDALDIPLYPDIFSSCSEQARAVSLGGLEAGIIALEAMGATDIDSRIIDQTRIEATIQLVKHVVRNLLCPAFDASSRSGLSTGEFSGTSSVCGVPTEILRFATDMSRRVCEIFHTLQSLVERVHLTDSVVLQLTNLGMSTLCIDPDLYSSGARSDGRSRKSKQATFDRNVKDPSVFLQLDAIGLIQQIFSHHAQHRAAIFEDIFSSVSKLPTGRKNLRSYSLIPLPVSLRSPFLDTGSACTKLNSAQIPPEYIMMTTALLLHLVHSNVEKPKLDEIQKQLETEEKIPCAGIESESESSETSEESDESSDGSSSESEEEASSYEHRIMALSVAELKQRLKSKNLVQKGRKTDLQQRLLQYFEKNPEDISEKDSENDEPGAHDQPSSQKNQKPSVNDHLLQTFLRTLVKRCNMPDNKDSGYRSFLSHLVDDLLVILCRPEWPGGERVLRILTNMLSRVALLGGSDAVSAPDSSFVIDPSFRNTSVDLLGKICSSMHASLEHQKLYRLRMPNKVPKNVDIDGRPDDDGEEVACPCGISNEKGTGSSRFLLDCDCCHRWYHGSCMGIERHAVPDVWYCDECQILKLLQAQREEATRKIDFVRGLLVVPSATILDEDEEAKVLFKRSLKPNRRVQSEEAAAETSVPGGSGAPDQNNNECDQLSDTTVNRVFVLRQVIMNHLRLQTNVDPSVNFARQFSLSTWFSEPVMLKDVGASKREALEEKQLYCVSWDAASSSRSTIAASSTSYLSSQKNTPQLSLRANVYAALELTCLLPSFQNVSTLLDQMLTCLRDNSPSFRARTMKAISIIVDSNPDLIGVESFNSAIKGRFVDCSTAVREAVVDLIGKYAVRTQVFALTYHDDIQERVKDKGVSVRKRAIRSMRNMLLNLHNYARRTDIMMAFAERMADVLEQDSIKISIMDIFKEMWLEGTGGLLLSNSQVKKQAQLAKITAHDIIDFIARATSSMDWFVDMLKSAFEAKTSASGKDQTDDRKSLKQHATNIVSCLVDGLVSLDAMPDTPGQERRVNLFSKSFDKALTVPVVRMSIFAALRVFASADPSLVLPHTPVFCVYLKHGQDGGEGDSVINNRIVSEACLILGKMLPAWKDCDRSTMQTLQQDLQTIMFRSIPTTMVNAAKCWSALLSSNKFLSEPKPNDLSIQGFEMPIHIVAQSFYTALWKFRHDNSTHGISVGMAASIQRSLFGLGILCQAYDFDKQAKLMAMKRVEARKCAGGIGSPLAPIDYSAVAELDDERLLSLSTSELTDDDLLPLTFGGGSLVPGYVCEQVLSMYMHYLTGTDTESPPRTVDGSSEGGFAGGLAKEGLMFSRGIDGLGSLLVRRPTFMLRPRTHRLVGNSLNSPDPNIRKAILRILCKILEAEESKIEEQRLLSIKKAEMERPKHLSSSVYRSVSTQDSTTTSSSFFASLVYGDQDAESSIASAVIQVHQNKFCSLLLDEDLKVRHMCVTLITTLLRQGLMNPLPFIVSLQVLAGGDEDMYVNRLAFQAVVMIAEKVPHHVSGKFLGAICQTYAFQTAVYGVASALATGSRLTSILDHQGLKNETSSGNVGPEYASIFSRMYTFAIQNQASYKFKLLKSALQMFRPLLHDLAGNSRQSRKAVSNDIPSSPDSDFSYISTADDSSVPGLKLLCFVAETLTGLPYVIEEEPLFIIWTVDRMLCIHGTNTIDRASASMKRKKSTSDQDFEILHCGMYGLILLAQLRKHLKRVYQLSAAKIQNYDATVMALGGKSGHYWKGCDETPLSKPATLTKPAFKPPKNLEQTELAKFRTLNSMLGALSKIVTGIENSGSSESNGAKRKRALLKSESPKTSPLRPVRRQRK
jgi:hypothetical protein